MPEKFLLYGANGYTGELVAREAARQGLQPVLAGRNQARVTALATELDLECRIFGLEDPTLVQAGVEGVPAVLNCAGPFTRTASPLIDACLAAGAHYIDISGEPAQFERCAARDDEARRAGVMLLPGAGFDVVPTDCLAAHLKARLPSATHLTLGVKMKLAYSRGTATEAVERAHLGASFRANGRLVNVPFGSRTRTIDFGDGPTTVALAPWGDVASAYYTTGIPNIEVYFAFPSAARHALGASRYLAPLLRLGPVQSVAIAGIRLRKPGPDARERAGGKAWLWGEVRDPAGHVAAARLETPEAYQLTVLSTVSIMKRVLAGKAPAGYQTPALAYGVELVLGIPGVKLSDIADPGLP